MDIKVTVHPFNKNIGINNNGDLIQLYTNYINNDMCEDAIRLLTMYTFSIISEIFNELGYKIIIKETGINSIEKKS